jgi:hypothetical protein
LAEIAKSEVQNSDPGQTGKAFSYRERRVRRENRNHGLNKNAGSHFNSMLCFLRVLCGKDLIRKLPTTDMTLEF